MTGPEIGPWIGLEVCGGGLLLTIGVGGAGGGGGGGLGVVWGRGVDGA